MKQTIPTVFSPLHKLREDQTAVSGVYRMVYNVLYQNIHHSRATFYSPTYYVQMGVRGGGFTKF